MSENRLPDYLDHIRQSAEDACSFVDGLSKDDFLADRRTQSAVVMCLVVIGEAATKVMDRYPGFADRHPDVPWRSMRGMRNRIAHGYFAINLDVVWDTVQTALPELLRRLRTVHGDATELRMPVSDDPQSVRRVGNVLGAQVDALSWDGALERLLGWARARESRYVTICNVHVVVSAAQDAAYRDVINGSDMAAPDGAPVAWMLRRQGFAGQPRISGPDLMWALCERAAQENLPIYCYGSTEATLALLERRLREAFPALRLTMESPPFRELTPQEDAAAVERINASGAGIVFVGLGCPKQERWMAEHRGRVQAVMIGVGAAFDFHAGTVQRAPLWMQRRGLEWLHRLASEPRRLWRRYLVTNTLFVWWAGRQLLRGLSGRGAG